MCEFCIRHGEGKKWYLQMKNYALDLLSKGRRAKHFKKHILEDFEHKNTIGVKIVDRTKRIPLVNNIIRTAFTKLQKRAHFGQVIPIEDAEEILNMSKSVVRLPCVCRRTTKGRMEERYCIGVGIDAKGIIQDYPDFSSLEVLDKEEALKLIKDFDREGLVHSVWTFIPPYVGSICNCASSDCLAFKAQFQAGLKVMFKSEYICKIDWDKCAGCKSCIKVCQFGAISYSSALGKSFIDMKRCYGCGVCRATCPKDAIIMLERQEIPLLKKDW